MQKAQMPPLDEISLNCLESCDGCDGFDGCDGHSGGFYRYTGLRQPNDTSRGHVRGEYREQFGRSLGQQCEDIVSKLLEDIVTPTLEEFGSTSALSG
jgi:hypothetical protein